MTVEEQSAVRVITANVSIHPFALYSINTIKSLKPTASSGDRSFFERWNTLAGQPEEEVQCVSLSTAVDICGVQNVELLKLDVEDAELEILEGASNFDWDRIRRISLEFHNFLRPHCGRRVAGLLRSYGYLISKTARP
jgi:FkbM family methyltransferase